MENIFNKITKSLPKPVQQPPKQSTYTAPQQLSTKDLVARWQKKETPEDTSELLTRMKPTMSSAINSYAPGMANTMAVKAATLTLSALRSYNPEAGTDPSTHVFHNLKRLNRIYGKRGNIIPVSEQLLREQKLVADAAARFEDEHDREASLAELADATGLSVAKLQKQQNSNAVINDSSTISEESHSSTFTTKDVTDKDYFEYVYASVSPIDQKIMEWTSGMHNKQLLSNGQIAAKLHITPAAVSQRKKRIQQLMSDVRGLL